MKCFFFLISNISCVFLFTIQHVRMESMVKTAISPVLDFVKITMTRSLSVITSVGTVFKDAALATWERCATKVSIGFCRLQYENIYILMQYWSTEVPIMEFMCMVKKKIVSHSFNVKNVPFSYWPTKQHQWHKHNVFNQRSQIYAYLRDTTGSGPDHCNIKQISQ